ncbi:hypothetical protein THAOC_10129, partial [Thalassiosira oceanica]
LLGLPLRNAKCLLASTPCPSAFNQLWRWGPVRSLDESLAPHRSDPLRGGAGTCGAVMGVPPAAEARRGAVGPCSSTDEPIQTEQVSPLDRGGSRDGSPAISPARGCAAGTSSRPSSLTSFARGAWVRLGVHTPRAADDWVETSSRNDFKC